MSSCDRCQRNNKKHDASAGVLHPIFVEAQIWHQVCMDLIGLLPEEGREFVNEITRQLYLITKTEH